MTTSWFRALVPALPLAVAFAFAVAPGCKRRAPIAPTAPAVPLDGPAPAPAAILPKRGVGVDDPFARMSAASAKALRAGHAALRARKLEDARAAFASVIAVLPDHTAARFQHLRATVLAGRFDEAPDLWAELLVRDFVAYAGKLDQPKDLAPLRASPVWARMRAIENAARVAYAAGLSGGALFVGRTRTGAPQVLPNGAIELSLNQEIFHYDHRTRRYRRLTDTGGQVFALEPSADRKALAYLLAPAVGPLLGGEAAFRDPKGGALDLVSLETKGPAPFRPAGLLASQVTVCFTNERAPLWRVTNERGETADYAFDGTRSSMARAAGVTCAVGSGTTASTDGVKRSWPADQRTPLADAGGGSELSRAVDTLGRDRPAELSAISWAPGGKRGAFAGVLKPCASQNAKSPADGAHNNLYVWDKDKPRPAKIASAVSYFESRWLDDDHLLYEGGVEQAARLLVYDVTTNVSTPLEAPARGGLYGYPTLACPEDFGHDDADDDGAE